jgi:site-specific DNA recombinase
MKTAVYVRVSTNQQVQMQTIEQQLERLRAHSQMDGWDWQEEDVFRDEGYSGASLRRPGLDHLRDQVASARFDRVLITAPDRLARKFVHQLLLIEEFERAGCQVEFLDRPMSQDPHDQLLLQIRGAVAEYERTLIAERLRRGRQQRFQAGTLLPWTRPPYGYRLDPDHPRSPAGVRVEEVEAAIVAEIFALYLERGASLSSVGKHLMQRGIPSPSGLTRWTNPSIRRILSNPVYTGAIYAGRGRTRPASKRRSPLSPVGRRLAGEETPVPPEEWILVGQVPALVTEEQFALVQAKLATNQQFARRNNRVHTYLLRALVSCGFCRLACTGQTSRGRYAYYCCVGKAHPLRSSRDQKCLSRTIPMEQLDAVVWADLCDLLTHPDQLRLAFDRAQGGAWLPQELQARRETLRKASASLTNQLERLTEAYLAQVLSLAEFRRRRQEMEGRLAALESQARALEATKERQQTLNQMAQHMDEFCQRVQQGLDQATFEQKRALIELLIDRVVVTNEQVEIRYVIPTTSKGEQTRFYQLRTDYCRAIP